MSEEAEQRQIIAASALLQVIGASLKYIPDLRLETLIIFLAVCANEGIGVKELVFICALSDSMVSRGVDHLCRVDELLTVARDAADGRRRLVYLSEHGRDLMRELALILCTS